ncbi:MAG: response regulator transcription factor [Flavobacteriales bacterium]|nr:response regulator transcription factor [Flavobacteriales bacterium]MCB9166595.1 response regulator transcription factor [Flavobacteriales bacterium]
MPIRTLLADHADLALTGLRHILCDVERIVVVGEVRDAKAMGDALDELRPDVVLIDHTADGFDANAIRDGIQRRRRTRFISITPDPSPVALMNAIRGGVTSYVKKDCDAREIIDAVLHTADGDRFFCGKIVEAMQRASIDLDRLVDAEMTCEPISLSEREYEIIALIADGLSYTRIADQLRLSAHTVTTHRRNIMQKLGVNNTAALVMYAVKHGLTSPNKFLFNSTRS